MGALALATVAWAGSGQTAPLEQDKDVPDVLIVRVPVSQQVDQAQVQGGQTDQQQPTQPIQIIPMTMDNLPVTADDHVDGAQLSSMCDGFMVNSQPITLDDTAYTNQDYPGALDSVFNAPEKLKDGWRFYIGLGNNHDRGVWGRGSRDYRHSYYPYRDRYDRYDSRYGYYGNGRVYNDYRPSYYYRNRGAYNDYYYWRRRY
jgi:hypothetical protein